MRIRQIVFAARHLAASRALLADVLALPTPFRDPGVAEFGLDNAVFCFGDQFIEVIAPVQAGTACGRHLDRQGDSGYMLILQTPHFDAAVARCASQGVRSVWQTSYPDIRAMHLHPKDVGGAIVSIDQPVPPQSWRWGGPDWRVAPGAAGRQRVRGITLRTQAPAALAARWANVFGLASAQVRGDERGDGRGDERGDGTLRLTLGGLPAADQPADDGGWVDFAPAAVGLGDGIAGFTLAVADPAAVLARARGAGLATTADAFTVFGTTLTLRPLTVAA